MSLLQFELPVTELMSDEIYNFPKTERNWDFYDYPEDIYLIETFARTDTQKFVKMI